MECVRNGELGRIVRRSEDFRGLAGSFPLTYPLKKSMPLFLRECKPLDENGRAMEVGRDLGVGGGSRNSSGEVE